MMKLTKAQLETLKEIDRHEYRGWNYWFREASWRASAELGLAKQYLPPSVAERPRMKARPYRVTDAGRAALSSQDQRSAFSPTTAEETRHEPQ